MRWNIRKKNEPAAVPSSFAGRKYCICPCEYRGKAAFPSEQPSAWRTGLRTGQNPSLIGTFFNFCAISFMHSGQLISDVEVMERLRRQSEYLEQYKFAFGFRPAGYWRVTELWTQESPRRSAREMSRIVNAILKGENECR